MEKHISGPYLHRLKRARCIWDKCSGRLNKLFGIQNMKNAKVIGIYPVEAPDPCHLVELSISGGEGIFDVGSVTQEDSSQPRDNWQCPYMERLISADGSFILTEPFEAENDEDKWIGEYRIGFFFHLLDTSKPLITPFGELPLPPESDLPTRLAKTTHTKNHEKSEPCN